jgi:hypothetical protein
MYRWPNFFVTSIASWKVFGREATAMPCVRAQMFDFVKVNGRDLPQQCDRATNCAPAGTHSRKQIRAERLVISTTLVGKKLVSELRSLHSRCSFRHCSFCARRNSIALPVPVLEEVTTPDCSGSSSFTSTLVEIREQFTDRSITLAQVLRRDPCT